MKLPNSTLLVTIGYFGQCIQCIHRNTIYDDRVSAYIVSIVDVSTFVVDVNLD